MEESPAEKGSLMELNNLSLINANTTMKNTKYQLKEDPSCSETVEKRFSEIYGDTISEEMFGLILK